MKVGVVGGGLFGCLIAIRLAEAGHKVSIFEATEELLSRASSLNQSRLHTGMHYPRDFETAESSLRVYERFSRLFPSSVKEIDQHYALASSSKVSFNEFTTFARRLRLPFEEVNADTWLRPGVAVGAIKVMEATLDFPSLRAQLAELLRRNRVDVHLGARVVEISNTDKPAIRVETRDLFFDHVVFATYAMNHKFASQIEGVTLRPVKLQVAQVLLGKVSALGQVGITLMDGNFWSVMPFGSSGLHSLTHVSFTPLTESSSGLLTCQSQHGTCGRVDLSDCSSCKFAPNRHLSETKISDAFHDDVLPGIRFENASSFVTVKSVPSDLPSQLTDARPTEVVTNSLATFTFVHSGKLGSALEAADRVESLLAS